MRLLHRFRFAAALIAAALFALPAAAFDTRATSAIIIDFNTGTVLAEHNARTPLPPASMSKLMTLYMLFEALENGVVDLDTTFSVSSRARQMGGSTMFLDERDRPTAEDLIRGIAVLSGNDASVVVAEGLGGSEDQFARLATDRARAMGMNDTTLFNASGWPHPEHRMSSLDLAILAQRMIEDFPQYYPYLAEDEFTWNGITQANRLPLLQAGIGVDGFKTGHTSEAGYGMVGSAAQGSRRVVFVISGLTSEAERREEAERIVNWAFRQFVERQVLRAGERVAQASVWMGETDTVGLVAGDDLRVLLPALYQGGLEASIRYSGPIPAPIAAGQEIGELLITIPELDDMRVPLYAETDVPDGAFMVRFRAAANLLLRRIREEVASL